MQIRLTRAVAQKKELPAPQRTRQRTKTCFSHQQKEWAAFADLSPQKAHTQLEPCNHARKLMQPFAAVQAYNAFCLVSKNEKGHTALRSFKCWMLGSPLARRRLHASQQDQHVERGRMVRRARRDHLENETDWHHARKNLKTYKAYHSKVVCLSSSKNLARVLPNMAFSQNSGHGSFVAPGPSLLKGTPINKANMNASRAAALQNTKAPGSKSLRPAVATAANATSGSSL